ncbi:MAG: leucyl aminopeptidase [Synergistaceae bacterium]|nr:leucyl aminopeptidase [Synergistaceae bacterium]
MTIRRQDEGFNAELLPVIGIIADEGAPETISLDPLRGEMRDFCRRVVVNEKFRGEAGSLLTIALADKNVKYAVIAGVGAEDKVTPEALREAAFAVTRAAASRGQRALSITMSRGGDEARSRAAAEGAVLAAYRFNKYLAADEKDKFVKPEDIVIVDGNERALAEGAIMAEAQCFARDLANEPANVITPESLAQKARELAEELGLKCDIWDEKRIADEKMGAYLAVASGSDNPPRFIHLSYEPEGAAKGHIALVGKGLTFDSGGLDIKPADFMTTMKGDKSGACAVLGAIRAAALMKLPWKVSAIVAAAENMPSGGAYRPDDILRARSGKTIEINNTDAEGRLTLADALAYASELKPDMIVDVATLTGACAVALGSTTAGLFTNNDDFGEKLLKASRASGERFWKLPMDDPNLRKQLKSPFADLVNCGARYGGAITAAMFLEAFVDKDIPWAHLDIAAADFVKKPFSYYVDGASGFGTRTLAELIREL